MDNADELKAELTAGPETSELSLLAAAYRRWGSAYADRVRGDFAAVIWDPLAGRITLCRDPFGAKLLFYRVGSQRVWIADRVDALLTTFQSTPALNERRIFEYLLSTFTAKGATFYRDLYEVPAAHFVTITRDGAAEPQQYWHPPRRSSGQTLITPKDGRETFRQLFFRSVQRRTKTESSFIVHVSGGLDSSSIAAAASVINRGQSRSILGAAAVYPQLSCDETPFIDAVAEAIRFPVIRWNDTGADPLDITDPLIDEPGVRAPNAGGVLGDIHLAMTSGVSVILSGMGGDQVGTVAGAINDMLAAGKWVAAIRELLFFPKATTAARLARLRHVSRETIPQYLLNRLRLAQRSLPSWINPRAADFLISEHSGGADVVALPHIGRRLWARVTSPQLARAVAVLQRTALQHRVEYRFPFLDRDLVDHLLTLPYSCWPRPVPFARFHREALAAILPPLVAQRFAKAEFSAAVASRLRRAQGEARQILEAGTWLSGDFVNRRGVVALFRNLMDGKEESRSPATWRRMWAVITLEAWMRRVLG